LSTDLTGRRFALAFNAQSSSRRAPRSAAGSTRFIPFDAAVLMPPRMTRMGMRRPREAEWSRATER
jgi:hypothetical protein